MSDIREGQDVPKMDVETKQHHDVESRVEQPDRISVGEGDLLALEHTDPVLNAKMHLINNAIDEIGMTPYQWKLFVLNGFG